MAPASLARAMRNNNPRPPGASPHKTDYIDGMRAAGYDEDIDKYIAMKIQGITPEYAQAMANDRLRQTLCRRADRDEDPGCHSAVRI